RLGVDEHAEPPVPFGHDLRRVRDRRDLQTGYVGAIDLTRADVEDKGDPTKVVGGAMVKRQVARTHQLARTGLDVTPRQVPRHRQPPFQKTEVSRSEPNASTDPERPHPRSATPAR